MLSFLTPQDQYDTIVAPEDNVVLESDGHTIWIIKNDKRRESITMAIAIEHWLSKGAIAEIQPK